MGTQTRREQRAADTHGESEQVPEKVGGLLSETTVIQVTQHLTSLPSRLPEDKSEADFAVEIFIMFTWLHYSSIASCKWHAMAAHRFSRIAFVLVRLFLMDDLQVWYRMPQRSVIRQNSGSLRYSEQDAFNSPF